jgi:hypothetical protein
MCMVYMLALHVLSATASERWSDGCHWQSRGKYHRRQTVVLRRTKRTFHRDNFLCHW